MYGECGVAVSPLVKPKSTDSILRIKLSTGMGHNAYGEIAWPNDLPYMVTKALGGWLSDSGPHRLQWLIGF